MDKDTIKKLKELVGDGSGDPAEAKKLMDEFLSRFDYKAGYQDSVEFLDENFAFFLTHVLNMGKPELDYSCQTADVMLPTKDSKTQDFRFRFNPTMFALLTTEERAFVMGHETMHVLLNHLGLLRRGKQKGKFKDQRKFNIAADCVINDYLVSMGFEPGRIGEYGCFGPKIVGYDCSNATVSDVYVNVPDQPEQEDGEGGDGEGSGEYDPLKDFFSQQGGGGTGEGQFDDHGWLENGDAEQDAAAEKIGEDAKASGNVPEDIDDKKQDDEAGSKYGSPGIGSGGGAMRSWVEDKGVSLAWAELLREIDPDVFKRGGPPPRPSYHQPRRKLVGLNRGRMAGGLEPIILPVKRPDSNRNDGEVPAIFMALDTSGSCEQHANTFVSLAMSVPQNKIKLYCATFSDNCMELDFENPKWVCGGTAFSPIESYILTKVVPDLGHYPKAVVIVTDGQAYFSGAKPSEEHRDRWTWMLTDGERYATAAAKEFGKRVEYDKFAKGVKAANIDRNKARQYGY
jgi:hypothetical protein